VTCPFFPSCLLRCPHLSCPFMAYPLILACFFLLCFEHSFPVYYEESFHSLGFLASCSSCSLPVRPDQKV
jgi:hypothetical protein